MHRKIAIISGITIFWGGLIGHGQNELIPKMSSEKIHHEQNKTTENGFYTGTVLRAKSAELSFDQKGRIVEMKPVGFTGNSQICDSKGNVIVKGDVLARLNPRKYELRVKHDKAVLNAAKSTLKKEKENYERYKKLAEKGSISAKGLMEAWECYETSIASVTRAEANLTLSEYELEACNLRAPFRGWVEKHYLSVGAPVDSGKPVLRYSLTSPVKIQVFLPVKILKKISITKPIMVYPNGSEKPVIAWFDERSFGADYIYLYVKNKLFPVSPPPDAKRNILTINKIRFITTLEDYKKEVPAWTPNGSIEKDDKGYFVWKAKDQTAIDPDKPISKKFVVEKIPVKPFDRFMNLGIYNYQALKDCGSLKKYDIVLIDAPETLKNGDTVILEELRYQFRPDEKVKVYIPSL